MKKIEQNEKELIISFTNLKKLNILNQNLIRDKLNNSLRNNYNITVLDLKGIEFIDSSVFRIIIEQSRISKIKGKRLYLKNISTELDEIIHLVHLENILEYKLAA